MKNEFIIKKDAFITCFSPFFPFSSDNQDTIAYTALLKKDIVVNFDDIKPILERIGIDKLKIIYIVKKDLDEEKM